MECTDEVEEVTKLINKNSIRKSKNNKIVLEKELNVEGFYQKRRKKLKT